MTMLFAAALTATHLLNAPAAAEEMPFDLGAGFFFNAGGTFMEGVDDSTYEGRDVIYSAWGGYGNGGGFGLDFRWEGIIGFELDFIKRNDVARSKFTINNVAHEFEATQSAWHIPLMIKVSTPKGVVRPNLMGGLEWVKPQEPSISQPDRLATQLAVHTEDYRMLAFGFGFDFVLPVEAVEVRIPLSFRGAYNDAVGSDVESRATYTFDNPDAQVASVEEIDFLTAWQWHAAVTLGVFVYAW